MLAYKEKYVARIAKGYKPDIQTRGFSWFSLKFPWFLCELKKNPWESMISVVEKVIGYRLSVIVYHQPSDIFAFLHFEFSKKNFLHKKSEVCNKSGAACVITTSKKKQKQQHHPAYGKTTTPRRHLYRPPKTFTRSDGVPAHTGTRLPTHTRLTRQIDVRA